MLKKIAVFVPAYNEAEMLSTILSAIPKDICGYQIEIVVADDGSTDSSVAVARQFTPHVLSSSMNTGVGANTKRGLEYICALDDIEYVIKLDGDGQHNPAYLEEVTAKLFEGNDVVVCSRFHPRSQQIGTPFDRIKLNKYCADTISELTKWHLTDARSGFMGLDFNVVKNITPKFVLQRYGMPMEILLRTWRCNQHAKIAEIPHNALYSGVSHKLDERYLNETAHDKALRFYEAFKAIFTVLDDMQVPEEYRGGAGKQSNGIALPHTYNGNGYSQQTHIGY